MCRAELRHLEQSVLFSVTTICSVMLGLVLVGLIITVEASQVISPISLSANSIQSVPYLSGPTTFNLTNSTLVYVSAPDLTYCTSTTFPLVPNDTNTVLVLATDNIGCYPEDVASAAASNGFAAIGIFPNGHPFGIRCSYLWKANKSPIPIVEFNGFSGADLVNSSPVVVDISPDSNPFANDSFRAFLRGFGALIALVALIKFVVCVQRLYGNLVGCDKRRIFSTAVAVSFLEALASLCSLIHFAVDPWGFGHVLPYPLMRLFVFGTTDCTIWTTYLVSRTFHHVLYQIKQSTFSKYLPSFLVLAFFIVDLVSLILDVSRASGFTSFSIVSVSVDMTFFFFFSLYYIYYKFNLVFLMKK
jgi:hypothetical protein